KFYTLFSMLFGMGFAVMMMRAEARGAGFVRIYLRRTFALLGFGLVHGYLIWAGDILTCYALMAFPLLLFFRRTKASRLWKYGVAFLLVPLVLGWAMTITEGIPKTDPKERQEQLAEQHADDVKLIDHYREAEQRYASGSYLDATRQRAHD